MSGPDRIRTKLEQIIATLKKSGQELADAFHEECTPALDYMRSITHETLDFDLIESDVRQFYHELEKDGSHILGSYLILKQDRNSVLVVIEVYKERDNNTLRNVLETNVKSITNIPIDIKKELMEQGKVKLHLVIE